LPQTSLLTGPHDPKGFEIILTSGLPSNIKEILKYLSLCLDDTVDQILFSGHVASLPKGYLVTENLWRRSVTMEIH
jgi:hypothetical protein